MLTWPSSTLKFRGCGGFDLITTYGQSQGLALLHQIAPAASSLHGVA